MTYKITKTDESWKAQLTPEQFEVCRKKELNKRLREFTVIVRITELTIVHAVEQNFFHLIRNLILVLAGQVFLTPSIRRISSI